MSVHKLRAKDFGPDYSFPDVVGPGAEDFGRGGGRGVDSGKGRGVKVGCYPETFLAGDEGRDGRLDGKRRGRRGGRNRPRLE